MNHALPAVRAFFQALAFPWKTRLCEYSKRGCSDMKAFVDGDAVVQKLYELQRDYLGAANQMTTNSPFRAELEAPPEPFVRASIVSHAYPKYQWKRMWADMKCNPEADCGGREGVKRTARLVKHLRKVALLNALGAVASLATLNFSDAATYGSQALKAGGQLGVISLGEWAYNKWVRGDPDSDGIVPAWSQIYPRTTADQQFHIPNADSHVGSTKSDKVRIRVGLALRNPALFNVPSR